MPTFSELKWTGMGEFNSEDHYIYYCGQESLRRNGIAIIVKKTVQNSVLGCNLKNDKMISVSKANRSKSWVRRRWLPMSRRKRASPSKGSSAPHVPADWSHRADRRGEPAS